MVTRIDMTIGELAERTATEPKTIRYYESIGLLPEPERNDSNYRLYSDGDVARITFVRSARSLGFRLNEIAEILALRELDEAPCSYVVTQARAKVSEIGQRIAELRALRSELQDLLAGAGSSGDGASFCTLIEHRPTDGA